MSVSDAFIVANRLSCVKKHFLESEGKKGQKITRNETCSAQYNGSEYNSLAGIDNSAIKRKSGF